MKHFPWKELGYTAAFMGVLLVLYVGSYYVLVEPRATFDAKVVDGGIEFEKHPAYRNGDFLGDNNLFVLMSSIDKKLRPNAWTARIGW